MLLTQKSWILKIPPIIVQLSFHCLTMLRCVCRPPPPSIRVGRRLSAPAPPLQLPYFIRGHQLSSVLRCQSQTWVFSFLLSLHSSLPPPSQLSLKAHSHSSFSSRFPALSTYLTPFLLATFSFAPALLKFPPRNAAPAFVWFQRSKKMYNSVK